ncbi:hypothetical protein ACLB1O_21550 [Escherichia coli]
MHFRSGTAMHVSTRSMPITMPCAANLAIHNGPTVFATHSTHKLLNALSQASYIHVREGRGAINFSRFNQAYMMHATTSPAVCHLRIQRRGGVDDGRQQRPVTDTGSD